MAIATLAIATVSLGGTISLCTWPFNVSPEIEGSLPPQLEAAKIKSYTVEFICYFLKKKPNLTYSFDRNYDLKKKKCPCHKGIMSNIAQSFSTLPNVDIGVAQN